MERETGDGEEKGRGQEEKGRGRVKGGRTGGGGERRMGKGRSRQRGRGDKYKCLCRHLRLVEQYQAVKPINILM